MSLGDRAEFAGREISLVILAVSTLLIAVSSGYGPHRDELYFASASDRLAWGYPDQPSMVAVSAWLSDSLAPGSLVALRLPSVVAVAAVVAMTAATARLLGGGRAAQTLVAVLVGFGAITLALGHRLTTSTFEYAFWSGVLLLATSALVDDRPRQWLWAGVVAGVGLHAKHSLVMCLIGLLVGILVTRDARHHLRSPWLWLGGVVALLLWLPNLWWQAQHGWPVQELSADIQEEYGGLGARLELVLLPLVMFSPLMAPVWLVGGWQLLRAAEWSRVRPLAWVFVVSLAVFAVTGGKAYYVAPAMPVLLAAGAVWLTAHWPVRKVVWAGVAMVAASAVAWAAFLPLLPPSVYAASPYPDLDEDQLETIGWPEYADTIRGVVATLPADERSGAVLFTGNYGEAGAAEWYGVGVPVYSGHNGWGDWGPPPDDASPVIVVGQRPTGLFAGCSVADTVDNDAGADNEERGTTVWLCDRPIRPWSVLWPGLVHLDA